MASQILLETPQAGTSLKALFGQSSKTMQSKQQTATAPPASSESNADLLPAIAPVSTLQDGPAQTFTHIHTALVPLIYLAGFSSVVSDPISGLTSLLVPIAALQGAYCALCLPPSSGTATPDKTKRRPGQPAVKGPHWTSRIAPTLISLTSALLLTPPILFVLLVVHGAPLTTQHSHTALLALHVALLATPALFYSRGLGGQNWRQIVSVSTPFDECMGAALGALVGCWLGAIPIPLDWDREWQKWPVTICTGAYLGWAAGKVVGGTVAWGRTLDFA